MTISNTCCEAVSVQCYTDAHRGASPIWSNAGLSVPGMGVTPPTRQAPLNTLAARTPARASPISSRSTFWHVLSLDPRDSPVRGRRDRNLRLADEARWNLPFKAIPQLFRPIRQRPPPPLTASPFRRVFRFRQAPRFSSYHSWLSINGETEALWTAKRDKCSRPKHSSTAEKNRNSPQCWSPRLLEGRTGLLRQVIQCLFGTRYHARWQRRGCCVRKGHREASELFQTVV